MKTTTKRNAIKKWAVEATIENIEAGRTTLADVDAKNPSMATAVRKLQANTRREARSGESLYGEIVRESEKAVLFKIAEGVPQNAGQSGEAWWPKSQVTVADDALAQLAVLVAPAWLIAKKVQ